MPQGPPHPQPVLDIRRAEADEMEIISTLANRIWPVCYAELIIPHERDNMLMHIYGPDSLRAQQREGQVFWIASLAGEDVGFASASSEGNAIRIHKLYVLPEMNGRGIGRQLVNAALAHFPGKQEAFLYMHRENMPARSFYERLGFAVTGDIPVKMGDFHYIDLIFSKSLQQD